MEEQMKQMLEMMTAMSQQQKEMEEKVSKLEVTEKVPEEAETPTKGAQPALGNTNRAIGPKVDPPPKFAGKEEEWRMFSFKMRSFYGSYLEGQMGAGWIMSAIIETRIGG